MTTNKCKYNYIFLEVIDLFICANSKVDADQALFITYESGAEFSVNAST